MDTQNNRLVTNSLIEELQDEELANCMGGCGWHWTRQDGTVFQGDFELNADGKAYTFTAYWIENGQILSHSFQVGLNEAEAKGIYYDASPDGSRRFWSDRGLKESFSEVDVQQVLEKVVTLPVTTWKYTQEPDSVRHMGPMAQDFAATFELGDSDRSIHVVDANGVTIAAIQALYQMLQARDAELNSLKAEIQVLKQQSQVA